MLLELTTTQSGGRLDMKMPFYQHKDPRVKDKAVTRQSYL